MGEYAVAYLQMWQIGTSEEWLVEIFQDHDKLSLLNNWCWSTHMREFVLTEIQSLFENKGKEYEKSKSE